MELFSGSKHKNHLSTSIGNYIRYGLIYSTITVIFLFLIIPDSSGQINKSVAADFLYNYFNTLYRLDQNLVNGVKYYKSPEPVSGNEFFLDEKSSPGEITVNGIVYPDVFLKYDLVKQDVILEYDYPPGGKMQIIIDREKITEFIIFGKTFKKLNFPSTGDRFYQIITAGNLVCLIYWTKMLIPTSSSMQYTYIYSEENRKTYLLTENQLCQFTGQKSFLGLFSDHKEEIRKFMKRRGLEIRYITDKDLFRLLEYCDDLNSNSSADTIR